MPKWMHNKAIHRKHVTWNELFDKQSKFAFRSSYCCFFFNFIQLKCWNYRLDNIHPFTLEILVKISNFSCYTFQHFHCTWKLFWCYYIDLFVKFIFVLFRLEFRTIFYFTIHAIKFFVCPTLPNRNLFIRWNF